MKTLILAAACASALGLGGCATSGLKPEQAIALVDEMHKAGCGGSFGVHGGASTGQLGGQASVDVNINATCPTAPVAPGATVAAPDSAPASAPSAPPAPPAP